MNLAHKFTGFYMVTVFYKKFYGCIGIKQSKGSFKNLKTADNAIFFADQVYLALLWMWHNTVCGYVLTCDIFF